MADDDPHGWLGLRSYSERLASLLDTQDADGAKELRNASAQLMPSELMGELGINIARLLKESQIPSGEVNEASKVLDDIRTGFRRVGTEPTF